MQEYESLGPQDFWKKWSVHGKRCTPSKILDGLAKERRDKERADANAAKAAYATDFKEVFAYRKGAQTFKMVSEKAIARRFQQLNSKKPY